MNYFIKLSEIYRCREKVNTIFMIVNNNVKEPQIKKKALVIFEYHLTINKYTGHEFNKTNLVLVRDRLSWRYLLSKKSV